MEKPKPTKGFAVNSADEAYYLQKLLGEDWVVFYAGGPCGCHSLDLILVACKHAYEEQGERVKGWVSTSLHHRLSRTGKMIFLD